MDYLWVKALHLIAVMSWMAGLLYLPRLFVYHSMVEVSSVRAQTFKLMERRLIKAIMNPAMFLSLGLGLWLLYKKSRLISNAVDVGKTYLCYHNDVNTYGFARMRRQLEMDKALSDKTYRWWNEVPTILMVIIVIMAVVEPF